MCPHRSVQMMFNVSVFRVMGRGLGFKGAPLCFSPPTLWLKMGTVEDGTETASVLANPT